MVVKKFPGIGLSQHLDGSRKLNNLIGGRSLLPIGWCEVFRWLNDEAQVTLGESSNFGHGLAVVSFFNSPKGPVRAFFPWIIRLRADTLGHGDQKRSSVSK